MFTKAKAKLIQSLKDKKGRRESGLFVVEGPKIISELPASKITVNSLFATSGWIKEHAIKFDHSIDVTEITEHELKQLSQLSTPNQVLALCEIPHPELNIHNLQQSFSIALDGLQDPGNMGTILRIADWYGINTLLCSPDCVDVFNPKVIQASMGSFMRVEVCYLDLKELFSQVDIPVLGALMEGDNLHTITMPKNGILCIGNEGSGIGKELIESISQRITIPKIGHAESLNAALAAGIICDAWARAHFVG